MSIDFLKIFKNILRVSTDCVGLFCLREKMKEFAKSFYKSKAWQHTRSEYAASVGGLCEACLRKGLYKAGEIVHHKKELTPDNITDPTVALSWDNLELLCRDGFYTGTVLNAKDYLDLT